MLKEGDRVAGFVHGGKFPDRGTFAEYIKIDENRAFKVPANMKSEVACQLGVAWGTAAMVSQDTASPKARPSHDDSVSTITRATLILRRAQAMATG